MVERNGIFRLFRFSGILGQPREVLPKFRNEIPENVCSIRSPTRNFRNFWSNGKRPLSRLRPRPHVCGYLELFLSGYGYRPHAYGEFASKVGIFLIRSPEWEFLNPITFRIRVDGRIRIFSDTMSSQNWRQYLPRKFKHGRRSKANSFSLCSLGLFPVF